MAAAETAVRERVDGMKKKELAAELAEHNLKTKGKDSELKLRLIEELVQQLHARAKAEAEATEESDLKTASASESEDGESEPVNESGGQQEDAGTRSAQPHWESPPLEPTWGVRRAVRITYPRPKVVLGDASWKLDVVSFAYEAVVEGVDIAAEQRAQAAIEAAQIAKRWAELAELADSTDGTSKLDGARFDASVSVQRSYARRRRHVLCVLCVL